MKRRYTCSTQKGLTRCTLVTINSGQDVFASLLADLLIGTGSQLIRLVFYFSGVALEAAYGSCFQAEKASRRFLAQRGTAGKGSCSESGVNSVLLFFCVVVGATEGSTRREQGTSVEACAQ